MKVEISELNWTPTLNDAAVTRTRNSVQGASREGSQVNAVRCESLSMPLCGESETRLTAMSARDPPPGDP
jgi:hypothetical protein